MLNDPAAQSFTHRAASIGPLAICEFVVEPGVAWDCGDLCGGYRVSVLRSGRVESVSRNLSITAGAGSVIVYPPEGHASARWASNSRMLGIKIDRCAVDGALSEMLGREVASQVDFDPIVRISTGAGPSWITMLLLLANDAFRPDGILTTPLAGLPYVDSLVRGLLLTADHRHRDAVAAKPKPVAPHAIRAAIDIIEAEPHLPLTVSELAARSYVSVRSLQAGFRRHVGMSPMAYARQVRLHRAHQALLESDPSTTTVASVAYRWGFTNLGRFAATHAARYGEAPAVTLRRRDIEVRSRQSSRTVADERIA